MNFLTDSNCKNDKLVCKTLGRYSTKLSYDGSRWQLGEKSYSRKHDAIRAAKNACASIGLVVKEYDLEKIDDNSYTLGIWVFENYIV